MHPGLGADKEHGTFFKFCLETKFQICTSSTKTIKKRKCVQELFKEMDCQSEMNIIGEGDSEKENIDVETSAMEETRSLAYTSIGIQTDLSM